MRAHEFLTESKILSEGLMKNSGKENDWAKLKYLNPFIEETLPNDQLLSFGFERTVKKSNGKPGKETYRKFPGKIVNGLEVAELIKKAYKAGTLNQVTFSVQVYEEDEDGNEKPTKEVVNDVRLNNIYKDEKVTGTLTNINLGDISEMILGCAVAAKFEKQDAMVTEEDIKKMGQRLAEGKGLLQTTAGKDTLQFKVTVPFKAKKVFFAYVERDSRRKTLQDYGVPENIIATMGSRVKSAAQYANQSKRILSAINEARDDPGKNRVDVISEGGDKDAQVSTKVDLTILIDGKPTTGKRLLSIKAGNVGQFGQVGGYNFDNINEFFTSSVGVNIPDTYRKYFYDIAPNTRDVDDQKIYNYETGVYKAYEYALRQIKSRANSDEAGLLQSVYKGLMFHLTRNQEGVEMVILEPSGKKAFSELSFGPEFQQALNQLKIYVVELGGNEPGLGVYGFPQGAVAKKYIPSRKDADSKLVDLRSQQTKTLNVRNRINMGNLLKNIADIENYIEKVDDQQQKQPAAKTPAPVQGVTPAGTNPSVQKAPVVQTKSATKPLPNVGKPMGRNPAGAPLTGQTPSYTNQ
jgi:hypothetical protein